MPIYKKFHNFGSFPLLSTLGDFRIRAFWCSKKLGWTFFQLFYITSLIIVLIVLVLYLDDKPGGGPNVNILQAQSRPPSEDQLPNSSPQPPNPVMLKFTQPHSQNHPPSLKLLKQPPNLTQFTGLRRLANLTKPPSRPKLRTIKIRKLKRKGNDADRLTYL